ncbi:hypothetical protein AB0E74_17620 [Streptomyces sp. NPDC030392]|uniref:hypothetical protein n=1 Tax=Streptomyces sp. NPDC030392 TaxID=3155468 RepID=UPI0033E925E0
MDNSSETTAEDRPKRRRHLPIPFVLLLAFSPVPAAFGAVVWMAEEVSSDLTDKEMTCCWEDGATPAWMSERIGIRIPETASDRRAGYKVGERYDTGLLSFVLRSDEAAAYTGRLVPPGIRMSGNLHPEAQGYRPAAAFGHLGLREPETLVQGLRRTSLCPDGLETSEGQYLQRCIDLFTHEFKPGATRIYIRSTIEPSVTPPPSSDSS